MGDYNKVRKRVPRIVGVPKVNGCPRMKCVSPEPDRVVVVRLARPPNSVLCAFVCFALFWAAVLLAAELGFMQNVARHLIIHFGLMCVMRQQRFILQDDGARWTGLLHASQCYRDSTYMHLVASKSDNCSTPKFSDSLVSR